MNMNADNQILEINGYTITTDPSFMEKQFGITPRIKEFLEGYSIEAQKGSPDTIKKLNRLCSKYPEVPQFKNYLFTAYNAAGKKQKAYEVNRWMQEKHPGYLYGKISLAAEYLMEDKPEKVPEILGKYMQLKKLYPDRQVFHVGEVLAFNSIIAQYYLKLGELEKAKSRLNMMKKLDHDHQYTRYTRASIMKYRLKTLIKS
jgi:tetratricopeptide (TPR) repeat protein